MPISSGVPVGWNSPQQLAANQALAGRQAQVQRANQGLAAGDSAFQRDQAKLDYGTTRDNFMDFLGGLKNNGYLGDTTTTSTTQGTAGAPGGGAGAGFWTPAPVSGIGGGSPAPAAASLGSPVASDAAAFAKAKDRVGQSTQGLMKALQSQFSGRNMLGSSAEGTATSAALLGANQQLADVSRDQAIKESDDTNSFAKTGYEGSIAQRGQDLSNIASQRAAALSGRGQDIGLETAREGNATSLKLQQLNQRSPAAITGLWNAFLGQPRY